jgi:4-amino-4-deoxy-L-arabinose transferase-like glycosyltransferase
MRGAVAACVLVGLALRLAFALLYWTGQPLTHDEREYLALARSVARGDGFRYPADEPLPGTAQRFGRAPGYPAFLAALHVTTPVEHVPKRVQIAQALIGALAIWLMASIATRAAGPRAGLAAAAIASVYPPLIWLPAYAWSETLYSCVALAAARALMSEGHRSSVLGGILIGLAILIRPAMVFFVPLAIAWMLSRRKSADAAVFVAIAVLSIAPWTIRNYRVYGRWIVVASEGGVTFWTGNHPLARGDGDLAANPELKRADLAFRQAHSELTPEQLEPVYYRDALGWIRAHPVQWMALVARKAFYTVVPVGPSYTLHSAKYLAASVASYGALSIAALAGAWRWVTRRKTAGSAGPIPLWLMAAATIMAGLVFFPQERFRLPVIDPALIVTAALIAGLRRDEPTGRYANV